MKKQKGLTLIELLAVIAIIAILFVLLIPQISSAINKAKEAGIMNDIHSFEIAIKSYFFESNEENITVKEFNKYLDKELKLDGEYNSSKKNAYGHAYSFQFEEDNKIRIRFKNDKEKIITFEFFIQDGEYKKRVFGEFANLNEKEKVSGDFYYILKDDGKAAIAGYKGESTTITIPDQIEGINVDEIFAYAFSNSKLYGRNEKNIKIKNVSLNNSIKKIGLYAFRENEITEVTLPNNLEAMERGVFEDNKINKINWGSGLKKLGPAAFAKNELTTVFVPNSINYLGVYAFSNNRIENITLQSNLTVIDIGVFMGNKLTNITIPSSITKINKDAFNNNPLTTYKILGNPIIDTNAFPTTAVRN